jgi:hypothetical protein
MDHGHALDAISTNPVIGRGLLSIHVGAQADLDPAEVELAAEDRARVESITVRLDSFQQAADDPPGTEPPSISDGLGL